MVTESAMNSGEDNHSGHGKKLSSSSSSSHEDAFNSNANDNNRLSPGVVALPDHASALASPELGDGISVSSISTHQQYPSNFSSSNVESATQSPTLQVMDRSPGDPSASPSYRIPSCVFARSKSSTPMEWSAASSESLFSIHMGNMSFTRDQANWFAKSGELGLAGDLNILSGPMSPMVDYSSNPQPRNQSPIYKSGEVGRQNAGVFDHEHLRLPEAKAAETTREFIKENQVYRDQYKCKVAHRSSSFRRSDASAASVKSFAFPILTGIKRNSSSQQQHTSPQSQPQTPKVCRESQHKPESETSNPEVTPNKPPSTVPETQSQSKWFSCLPCCSTCT